MRSFPQPDSDHADVGSCPKKSVILQEGAGSPGAERLFRTEVKHEVNRK